MDGSRGTLRGFGAGVEVSLCVLVIEQHYLAPAVREDTVPGTDCHKCPGGPAGETDSLWEVGDGVHDSVS